MGGREGWSLPSGSTARARTCCAAGVGVSAAAAAAASAAGPRRARFLRRVADLTMVHVWGPIGRQAGGGMEDSGAQNPVPVGVVDSAVGGIRRVGGHGVCGKDRPFKAPDFAVGIEGE